MWEQVDKSCAGESWDNVGRWLGKSWAKGRAKSGTRLETGWETRLDRVWKVGKQLGTGWAKSWEQVGKRLGTTNVKRLGKSWEKVVTSWEQVGKRLGQVGEALRTCGKRLGQVGNNLKRSLNSLRTSWDEDHHAAKTFVRALHGTVPFFFGGGRPSSL